MDNHIHNRRFQQADSSHSANHTLNPHGVRCPPPNANLRAAIERIIERRHIKLDEPKVRSGRCGYWWTDCPLARKRHNQQKPEQSDFIHRCRRPSCPACTRLALWGKEGVASRLELGQLRTYAVSFPARTILQDRLTISSRIREFIDRQLQRLAVIRSCEDIAAFAVKIEATRGPIENSADGIRHETIWGHIHAVVLVDPAKAKAVAKAIGASLLSDNPVSPRGLRYLLKPHISHIGFDRESFVQVATAFDTAASSLGLETLFWRGGLFDGRRCRHLRKRHNAIVKLQKQLEPYGARRLTALPTRVALHRLIVRQHASPLGRLIDYNVGAG
jgi:hypothetical protein